MEASSQTTSPGAAAEAAAPAAAALAEVAAALAAAAAPGGGGAAPAVAALQGERPCLQYHGARIADKGSVAASLLGHYLAGHGDPVVIDWSYFSRNASFVKEAKSLHIGQFVSGWSAPFHTDMYAALGHFTIERDTADCYLVYDHYDFEWRTAKAYPGVLPVVGDSDPRSTRVR